MIDTINKNIFSVYISTLIPAGLTYIFWIIVSNYTNSEIIGVIAAIGSFSMILGVLSNFDIGVGMKRFLGIAVSDKEFPTFKQITSTAIIFTLITSISVLIIVLNPFLNILETVGIGKQFIPIIIAIVIGNDLQHILIGSLISALKSKSIVLPTIISSISRFVVLAVLFFVIDNSELTVAWSYAMSYIVICILLLIITIKYLKTIEGPFFYQTKKNLKIIIQGSFARWIPQIISVLGSQLSILAIFVLKGPSESGLFYIPFAVFNVLFLVSGAINQVSHPILSGMKEEENQIQFLKKALKMTFLGTMPFAAIMFFYAKPVLSIFGTEFTGSNEILSLLLYSFPIAIITEGVYFFFFARGNYKNVLILGLISNISRIILYFILVPEYGGMGGAIAFIVGTVFQMILTVILLEKKKIRLEYGMFMLISIIPFLFGYIFEFLKFNFIGGILLFILSLIIYLRIKAINEVDIENIIMIIVKKEKAIIVKNQLIKKLKKIHII